jgi:hypothetical protein
VDNKLIFEKILITGGIPRSSEYAGKTLLPLEKTSFN